LQGKLVIPSLFSRRQARRVALLWAALVALALSIGPLQAQQAEPTPQAPTASPKPAGDTMSARIGSIEEQLKGLKVTVGTLESLLRSKPGVTLPEETVQAPRAVAGPEGPSEIDSRIEALETQVSALTSQIEQMTKQLTALQARPQAAASPPLPPSEALRPLREGETPTEPSGPALASSGGEPDTLGAKSILPEQADEEEPVPLPPDEAAEEPMQSPNPQPTSLAAFPPADATTLYNQGYGDLLRRDYASAETAFRRLLEAYPNDKLAGDAQYWLGESYYVRGQYKNAADTFLKGYKSYGSNPKAPDSLLKLGMSLAALGQKEAACSSFAELGTKFPTAPSHVRDEANAERHKAGC
jgi:tol-pal system protein YbgF